MSPREPLRPPALVKVRFFSFIRRALGTAESEAEAGDVRALIEALSLRFGPAFRDQVIEVPGRLRDDVTGHAVIRHDVTVLVNGRNIHFLAGLDTSLRPGDEVVFIPPAAGGGGVNQCDT